MSRSLALSLLLFVSLSTTAAAQTAPAWNRMISDVHIVHPPGTPPGTWKIQADLDVYTDATVPLPADLGCDATLSLNGTPIGLQSVALENAAGPLCMACNGGQCGQWSHISGQPFPGFCKVVVLGSGATVCGCRAKIVIEWGPFGTALVASDQLTIDVSAAASALPESYTADDSSTITVANNPIGDAYCFGDGTTATACPCANTGLAGHGCENSAGTGGALLQANGLTSPDSAVLTSSGELASSLSIFLQGSTSNASGVLFGDGVRCAGGNLKRLYVRNASAGTVSAPAAGDPSVTAMSALLGDPIAVGSVRHYQVYYRDPNLAFCPAPPGGSFNVTNAVALIW